MNENSRNRLPQLGKHISEYAPDNNKKSTLSIGECSLKIHDRLVLDENISNIINKYKTINTDKKYQKSDKKIVDKGKTSTEERKPLKCESQKTSVRNNCIDLHDSFYDQESIYNHKSFEDKPQLLVQKKSIERLDKTTYCRPITKYNKEFYNAVEKNNNLRDLLKKLSFCRQKEAAEYLCNKYMRSLKKKHILCKTKGCQELSHMQDVFKARTKYYSKKREPHNNLNEKYIRHADSTEDIKTYKGVFYPLVHSSRKMMYVSNSETNTNLLDEINNSSSSQVIDDRNIKLTKQVNRKPTRTLNNCETQVNSIQVSRANFFKLENIAEKKDIVQQNYQKQDERTLKNKTIETKIDILIKSINDFTNEVRLQRIYQDMSLTTNKEKNLGLPNYPQITRDSVDFTFDSFKNTVHYTQPPSSVIQKDRTLDSSAPCDICVNTYKENFEKINEKSTVKFEVPTRDGFTEISNSFFRQIRNTSYQVMSDTRYIEKATVALNTEPMSLVALLKVSSEAIRGFFSFGFLSHFPYLQLPRLQWGEPRPSVCAANVKMQNTTNSFFKTQSYSSPLAVCGSPGNPLKCKYCDTTFDRAYSWELHEFSCARSSRRFLKIMNE